ncbi:histone acetyltransferase type B catalytic subunit [Trichoderma asperellum]|uniref:Histone acetyltransferase type B catalytic subunit n=1 Tax=Trichoderma asperellum TaxID=101201 RepID=A0A6V8QJ02_TRIAP|nr:histone acetyltransferase type B [Trichoderma asperelloides]GFP52239.1 histone acetyltransferase type B catalytic subunit [Trichoderma asperellum]
MAGLPDLAEWLQDSNDALNISLVAPSKSGLNTIATFHPKFTYSIFGDDEKIFGYKDLKIQLRYRANDMRPHLRLAYSKKFKPVGEHEPTDVVEILEEGGHLPKVAFAKASDFENSSQQLGDDWSPPGTLHETFQGPDGQYEIWKGTLVDPAVKQLNSRIQILVPMLIDGGSYIGQDPESDSPDLDYSDADRWTFFFLYRKQKSTDDPEKSAYTFVGYATVYRFFYFKPPMTPPASPGENWELPTGHMDLALLPCRTRLSQFIILPPFQGKGSGARLYNTVFKHYHSHAQTHEFTVENPNEAFDDLRDICDLAFLRTMPEFNELHVDTTVKIPKSGPLPPLITGAENLEKIRLQAKIAPRQFYRVLEVHLMSQLPRSVRPTMSLDDDVPSPTAADKHNEKLWQLIVKQRLYRHNKEALAQVDVSQRIGKLSETLSSVALEYARLLAAHDRAVKHSNQPNGKRKLDEPSADASSSKKARVEDA